jgi:hypothetical protein
MKERRRFPRNPAHQRAYVVLAARQPTIPCTITELSSVGTLVRVHEPLALPTSFHLLMGATELVSCRTVRQSGNEAGVEFSQGSQRAPRASVRP